MHFDAEAQPELPVPDHVPDDLITRFGPSARRIVRRSRSRHAPLLRATSRARATVAEVLHDADLWLSAFTIFVWAVVGAGSITALWYAVSLLPGAVPLIVAPMAVLCVASIAGAVMWERRKAATSAVSPAFRD